MDSSSTITSFKFWLQVFILTVYLFFCYLMFKIMWQYIYLDTDVAFLRIKQPYIPMLHYRIAFFIHVFTSILVLPAGFTQFLPYFRKKLPRVHKISGWIYSIITILLAAPSGFVIGLYANGGLSSQIAFCSLGFLWIWFTIMAIYKIRKRKVVSHQKWMIRSFALAMSAITLRAWKFALVAMFHPKPMDAYIIVAWLGWVLNLLIAELIIYKHISK